jgi:hypothetical protein
MAGAPSIRPTTPESPHTGRHPVFERSPGGRTARTTARGRTASSCARGSPR